MARNAADAAKSARPKGEHFSGSLRMFYAEVLVTNRTGWEKPNPRVQSIGCIHQHLETEKFS
jgi:hypothetical protein